MKHPLVFIFSLILVTSCNYVPKEVPNAQALLRKELHAIDWNKVDNYPSYESCDSIKDEETAKKCFFERLEFETYNVLKNDSLVQISTIDSVEFLVTLTSKSELHFKTKQVNEKLLPKFMLDSIMEKHQKSFSKIQPATKRGIPVTTQFDLTLQLRASLD